VDPGDVARRILVAAMTPQRQTSAHTTPHPPPQNAPVRLARLLLLGSAGLHLYFGAAFALAPGPWMESLSIQATSPAGLVEMRAFYGGLMLALGALFAAAGLIRRALLPGVVGMTVTYLGAACVRGLAMLAAGTTESPLRELLAVEAGGAVLGALVWWRSVYGDVGEGGSSGLDSG